MRKEQLMGFNKYVTELSVKIEDFKELLSELLLLVNSIENDKIKMASYITTLHNTEEK